LNDDPAPLVLSTITGPSTPVVQVGIVSWGINVTDPELPDVYTRVSAVAGWIKETVCNETGELCQTSQPSASSKPSVSASVSLFHLTITPYYANDASESNTSSCIYSQSPRYRPQYQASLLFHPSLPTHPLYQVSHLRRASLPYQRQ
jgi:secreted trypsin-like serine protease